MTILSSDIRSGNYFEYLLNEDDQAWVPTMLDLQDIARCEQYTHEFNTVHRPIAITPQWLNDLGYVHELTRTVKARFDSDSVIEREYSNNPFEDKEAQTLIVVIVNDQFDETTLRVYIKGAELITLTYVHELQNLVYLINKTELLKSTPTY